MQRSFWLAASIAVLAGLALGQTPRPNGLYAEVQTAKGRIVIQLRPDVAPMAVANFVGLAEGTIANAALDPGQPFFDHTTFHRVVYGHVIQTGMANSTKSRGPGYSFPNEIDTRMSHNHAGAVNMANGGPGTNASQWCITLADRSYLDGDFTVFGQVVEGLEVAQTIQQGDALNSVRIVRVGPEAEAYHPTTASFQTLVAAAKTRAAEQVEAKKKAEADWIAANYPHATGPAGGVLTQVVASAPAGAPAAGGRLFLLYHAIEARYEGDWAGHSGPPIEPMAVASTFPLGLPRYGVAESFPYTPGTTKLNPGLDAVLATMRPGDHRIVIVPAAKGYGRGGLYPPEIHGQKRFVVSPDALLVYDIEALP